MPKMFRLYIRDANDKWLLQGTYTWQKAQKELTRLEKQGYFMQLEPLSRD